MVIKYTQFFFSFKPLLQCALAGEIPGVYCLTEEAAKETFLFTATKIAMIFFSIAKLEAFCLCKVSEMSLIVW